MTLRKSVIATLISTALALPAFAQDEFSKRLYVGFGGGTSTLTPESQIDGVFVDDDSDAGGKLFIGCLLYTSPSPRDRTRSRMPSSA